MYLRILNFARPFSRYVPIYFVYTLLGTLFGLLNFTFLIPLLNVLFDEVPRSEAVQMVSLPDFSFSIEYGKALFDYYFGTVLLETGKVGALKFVCLIILCSVLLSNLFKYLGQRVIVKLRAR